MAAKTMILEIISPEKKIYAGDVFSAKFPGERSPFTVLPGHAPMLSSLSGGVVSWQGADGDGRLMVTGGFVEILNNKIIACVEGYKGDE